MPICKSKNLLGHSNTIASFCTDFPQITSDGEYKLLTTLDTRDAFFVSLLATGAFDILLTSVASNSQRLHIQRNQNTLQLSLCTSADDSSTCTQLAQVIFCKNFPI